MKKILTILLLILSLFVIYSCDSEDNNSNNNNNDNQLIEENKENEKIDKLIKDIDLLPATITLDDKDILDNLYNTYLSLSFDGREKITNIDKLNNKRKEYDELVIEKNNNDKVTNVINLINNLPDVVTLNDKPQVVEARNAFNSLGELQDRVTNLNRLESKEEDIYYLEAAQNYIDLINTLPSIDEVKEEHRQGILNVKEVVDKFDHLELVTNYHLINDLLEKLDIDNLKELAQPVIDYIDSLPETNLLTYDDLHQVSQARVRYNNLSMKVKEYVTNYDKLVEKETRIAELKVIEENKAAAQQIDTLIDNLPTVDNLTINDKDQVENVRYIYDNSSNDVKQYVTKLSKLVSLENKLNELINNHEYEVRFYLNGGQLEGSSSTSYQTIESFDVNYYSTSFFTYYQTEIFIYKTSLMNSGDQFLYAYKLGFNYNSSTDSYLVSQVILNGTGLTESNKTCDYYLMAHNDYKDGFEKLLNIQIGDYLNFNKALPDSAATGTDIKVTATRSSVASDYVVINYKGTNTLPIPLRSGYSFGGWYTSTNYENQVIEVSDEITVYAKWLVNHDDITSETILNCVSDIVESDTIDSLVLEDNEATYTWKSSNTNLYKITNDTARTSKIYQTHKKQTVTVSVDINYKSGGKVTKQKTITINPVKFKEFSDTPIATYFAVGAASAYQKYNTRYKQDGSWFSEHTKENLEILNYSFATPSSSGTLSLYTPSMVQVTNQLKENDVRQVMVINGVGSDTSKAFYDLTKDNNLLQTFITNIMDMVEQYNFDGVDIDWEYVSSSYPIVASQVNSLVIGLRQEMERRSDEGGSSYLLTAAIPSSSWGLSTSRWDFPTLNNYLDYINIMSYDLHKTTNATHLSPLYSSVNDGGWGFGGVYGVTKLAQLGFSRNKLLIGCAGYGKAYKVTGTSSNNSYPALGAEASLTKVDGIDGSFATGTLYGNAIEAIINQGGFIEYLERDNSNNVVGSYLYNSTTKIFITYDSSNAIKAKYRYAKSIKGTGLMCWAYTEDTNDHYLDAIYDAMHNS